MSAVSCRQNMPELIAKIPDGQAKDLALKLRNGSERCVIREKSTVFSLAHWYPFTFYVGNCRMYTKINTFLANCLHTYT